MPQLTAVTAFFPAFRASRQCSRAALSLCVPDGFTPLFNGRDLEGWVPKITGYDAGVNFGQTFRVENGLLRVAYDQYASFGGTFGHLFYREPFSYYRLRVEYRFVGTQAKGGPGWALRNSGVMASSKVG